MIRALRVARTVAVSAALSVVVLLALAMLAPALAGYDRYVIVSGSMTGSYDRGSIVYTKTVPVADLRVGDTITYAPPPGMSPTELVTHRIASVEQGPDGPVFQTKGDANRTVDPWKFTLADATQPRVEFGIPYVGFLVAALSDRDTRMALIGGPALLVALLTLGGVARDVRRHRHEQRRGPAAAAAA